jgi:hypothetical protein
MSVILIPEKYVVWVDLFLTHALLPQICSETPEVCPAPGSHNRSGQSWMSFISKRLPTRFMEMLNLHQL